MTDYNIHIHVGGEGDKPKQSGPVKETSNKVGAWYDDLIRRVNQCVDWKTLYELREDFACIGLIVQETSGARKILCRMEEGKPISKRVIDDYIFVGSKDTMDEEIGERALEVMLHFIESNASRPQTLMNDAQSYSQNTALYGKPVRLANEDQEAKQQEINMLGRMIQEDA